MKPDKKGQIVKFIDPLPDEKHDQLYVVLEIKDGLERPRADIKPLGTGLSFPPVSTVLMNDLEVVELGTSELFVG